MTYDVAIIGGGIVGLATAYRLSQTHPGHSVVLLEKEAELASHQTGRNSGVIHSGIYYRPGSLKAVNCREGKEALVAFCKEEGVNYDLCGKVIVAVEEDERPRLRAIYERGRANGIACELIGPERLHELEPYVAGVEAIHVPEAGIVDYPGVCRRLAARLREHGHDLRLNTGVQGLSSQNGTVVLETAGGDVEARRVVNCAGLYADRIAAMGGEDPGVRIVPFRGEYFELRPDARRLCRDLIYPVPDPAFPFLGVHFTRMIDGSVECGPNAVLAFAREGYTLGDVDLGELWDALSYRGFRRLARRHWRTGFGELWRSISKKAFHRTLQRLIPTVALDDLVPAPAGVRAQAIDPDGNLVDDFLIRENGRVVNVCNAPSPAATAALNVGRLIVDRLAVHLA